MKRHLNKLILSTLLALVSTSWSWAQTSGINYQAVARDNSGALIANTNVNVEFEIRQGALPGTLVYAEDAAVTTNDFGLFNLVIGEGTATTSTFDQVDWAADEHYLIIELNGAKVDTLRFQGVPYSQVATDMSIEDLNDVSGISGASNGDFLQFDGSNWTAAAASSPWTTAGDDISFSGGRAYINRTSPITSSEYFGISAPTSGNAYGGMYVDTDSDMGRPFYGYAANGSTAAWTYWDGNDDAWKVHNGSDRMIVNRPGGYIQLNHGSDGGLVEGLLLQSTGSNNNSWALYTQNANGDLTIYHNSTLRGRFSDSDGVYTNVSDARLKTDVANLRPVLSDLLQLQVRSYRYSFQEKSDLRSSMGLF
ncbi:MAG: tail fiber domain-containing protein, partial [Bacteroidota bacterium]